MAEQKPIRRVVTGNDERGRSKVCWDGPAPDVHKATALANGWTDYWVWNQTPAPLAGANDDGGLPYGFPGPVNGGHLRTVEAWALPPGFDYANDPRKKAPHPPIKRADGNAWDRGGRNAYSSDMHKTETIDYAILLEGERDLVLDDGVVSWKPGDIVIDVGAFHQWTSPRQGAIVLYDMFAARFTKGHNEVAQGDAPVMHGDPGRKLPDGVRPERRIVCTDREPGKSCLVSDGPTPDVRFDAARPGFASSRMWVTDGFPAKMVLETLHLPHTIEPPSGGTVLRVVTVPPDDAWKGKVGAAEVQAYFRSMGSPGASTYAPQAPHPYMQKTRSLDFCVMFEGVAVLVLDTQEVQVKAGDIVILRGSNHAWSNRSNHPVRIAIASHDGA